MDSISSSSFFPTFCSSSVLDYNHLFCCLCQSVSESRRKWLCLSSALFPLMCRHWILLSIFQNCVSLCLGTKRTPTDGKKGNLIAKQINRCKLCPRRSTWTAEFSSSRLCTTFCFFPLQAVLCSFLFGCLVIKLSPNRNRIRLCWWHSALLSQIWSYGQLPAFMCTLLHFQDLLSQLSGQRG